MSVSDKIGQATGILNRKCSANLTFHLLPRFFYIADVKGLLGQLVLNVSQRYPDQLNSTLTGLQRLDPAAAARMQACCDMQNGS